MDKTQVLRQHVINLLDSPQAHVTCDAVLTHLAPELQGRRVSREAPTLWQLLEHLRIAQWDIVEFCLNPGHQSPPFPEGYWPGQETPPDNRAWEQSAGAFRSDLERVKELVSNPSTDLFARIPHGPGQTFLREALLVADHNAYHLGQMVLIRKLLGAWPEDHWLQSLTME